MSNVQKNEMKNTKNDLKSSIENLRGAVKTIEEMIADKENYSVIDKLLEKREEFSSLLFYREVLLDIIERIDRVEEKVDRLFAEKDAMP